MLHFFTQQYLYKLPYRLQTQIQEQQNNNSYSLFAFRQKNMSFSSLKSKEFRIDNILFNEYSIQSAIQQSDNKNKTISNIFRFCELKPIYQADPLDKSTKNQMKDLINSKFQGATTYHKQIENIKSQLLDLSKVYPLNKPGNFGRTLQRKCRIVPKGVLEFENQTSTDTKLKQTKSFINIIQSKNSSGNNPLNWHSEQKKYQHRIILIDNNGNNKGIYFQSKQEAEKARVYFCSIYKTKKIYQKTVKALQQNLNLEYWFSFNDCLIQLKNLKKKQEKSLLNQQAQFSIEKSQYNKSLRNSNLITNNLNLSKSELKKQQSPQSLKKTSNIRQNEKQQNFILTDSIIKPNTEFKKFSGNQQQLKSNLQFTGGKKQIQNTSQSRLYLSTIQKNLQKKSQKRGYLDQLFKIHQMNQANKSSYNNKDTQKTLLQSNTKILNQSNQVIKQFQNLNDLYIKETFQKWRQNAYQKRKNNINKYLFNTNKSNLSNLKKSHLIAQEQGLPQLTSQMMISKPKQKISRFQSSLNNSKISNDSNNGINSILQSRFLQQTNKNKQKIAQNRFQSRAKASRKQESIFSNQKMQKKQSNQQPIQRSFQSIQFLNINSPKQTGDNLFIKPIVTIKLMKKIQVKNKFSESKTKKQFTFQILEDYLFNTTLLKLHPHPEYQLVSTENTSFSTVKEQSFSNFFIEIQTIDFLTNKEITKCSLSLQALQMDPNLTSLMDKQHTVRLYIKNNVKTLNQSDKKKQKKFIGSNSMHLELPSINKDIIIKIKAFWQKQAISKSYYNMEDNFSLYDAVSNSSEQAEPLSWWLNLTQLQYTYLCILQSASKILNYKLIQPMLHLIRTIIKVNYKIQESVQILLSIIMNFGKYYYFPDQICMANYLHNQLGIKGNIGFQARVMAQHTLFKTISKLQMPLLIDKLSTRNIHLTHLMMEYTYQLFSRNFQIDKLIDIWNFSHQNNEQVPLCFFLLTLSLCKFYEPKLIKCKRLKEVIQILESKQFETLHTIKKYVCDLKEKYFYTSKNFLQQLKEVFKQRPLQRFSQFFYKKDQEQKQILKQERITVKKQFCKELINSNENYFQLQQNLSNNSLKKYVLHIYFYKLPQQTGNLSLKQGPSQYECVGYEKSRYFIIGQVKGQIMMKFINLKGQQYKNTLILNLGVNQFKLKLKCQKIKKQIQVQYLAGLLTEAQIQIFKNNKKYTHFFGPYLQKQLVNEQLLKGLNEIRHLLNQNNIKSQEYLTTTKALFGFGQKQFNQIEFYLYKINAKSITLIQKIVQIQKLSTYASKGLYLCDNKAIFKMLIQKFLKINRFQIKQSEFYCYYNDSLDSQFDAPKIMKCRFQSQGKQMKLQKQIAKFQFQRGFKYLYQDLVCEDIINFLKPLIIEYFGTLVSGDLKILYSTSGQIQMRNLKLIVRGKQLIIDQINSNVGNSFQKSIFHDISQKQPQILMTQVLPSFTKISTILDYVNTKKVNDPRLRAQEQQRKVIPEDIKLLRYCQKKFTQCILLRYQMYPTTGLNIPFLKYFYQLTTDVKPLKFRFYYINNARDSIKSICTSQSHIKYSGNQKNEEQKDFLAQLGLYGNLRKYSNQKSQTIYFWTYNKDQNLVQDCLVNISYGYGIYRWQKCKIKAYRRKVKVRHGQGKHLQAQSKAKIQYLVQYKDRRFFGRDYQVKLSQKAQNQLIQMQSQQGQKIQSLVKSDIVTGLQHLLGFINKKS